MIKCKKKFILSCQGEGMLVISVIRMRGDPLLYYFVSHLDDKENMEERILGTPMSVANYCISKIKDYEKMWLIAGNSVKGREIKKFVLEILS